MLKKVRLCIVKKSWNKVAEKKSSIAKMLSVKKSSFLNVRWKNCVVSKRIKMDISHWANEGFLDSTKWIKLITIHKYFGQDITYYSKLKIFTLKEYLTSKSWKL